MNRREFEQTLQNIVKGYIERFHEMGPTAQLSINPVTKFINVDVANGIQQEIADSEEVVEDEASAENPYDEDFQDNAAQQDPDYYSLYDFVKPVDHGGLVPDEDAILRLIAKYFD